MNPPSTQPFPFHLYATAALTGLLSNPTIIASLGLQSYVQGSEKGVPAKLVQAAMNYARIASELHHPAEIQEPPANWTSPSHEQFVGRIKRTPTAKDGQIIIPLPSGARNHTSALCPCCHSMIRDASAGGVPGDVACLTCDWTARWIKTTGELVGEPGPSFAVFEI